MRLKSGVDSEVRPDAANRSYRSRAIVRSSNACSPGGRVRSDAARIEDLLGVSFVETAIRAGPGGGERVVEDRMTAGWTTVLAWNKSTTA